MAFCAAVALAGQSAKSVPIQRLWPEHPPAQNVNSVALAGLLASQFSGEYAKVLDFVHSLIHACR